MTTIPPNQSLYVRNLDEHVHKEELRRSLYYLFSQHGQVIDVVALKSMKMRGQAFVVFREIASATSAMRSLQGFPLYSKSLSITYAKSKSNAVKIREGAYLGAGRPPSATAPAVAAGPAAPSGTKRPHDGDEEDGDAKRVRNEDEGAGPTTENPPNRILFLSNLPTSVSEDMLAMLFQQYAGFKEVRLVPGKTGIAFVEYETDIQADTAKTVLNGFKLAPTVSMGVEFAKI
ncbi:U2 small nuclear ribonucleoprotein B''-like protein [Powellomyces hirtus]|nr:U2 small nuclear ribonucleoprotein B''-like protein [Powellomyces hirtus]